MMTNLKYLLATGLVVISALAQAETIVNGGNISGLWLLSRSPYLVRGDVLAAAGDTLIIEPGVQVRFTGNYFFHVQGRLVAAGTETDSILFTRHLPTEESCWRGLRFEHADSTSELEYCRIEWVKSTRGTHYPFSTRSGGVCIYGRMDVRHCRIVNNQVFLAPSSGAIGGGIGFDQGGSGIVEYCHIARNESSFGGGIGIQDGWATIRYNVIEENYCRGCGGGIGVSYSPTTIHDNLIRRNAASKNQMYGRGGGIDLETGTPANQIFNNLILDNITAGYGGGIRISGTNGFNLGPSIYNNTVAGNRAFAGGGISVYDAWYHYPTSITNCIIVNNHANGGSQIHLGGGAPVTFSYCSIQDGWPGVGNISTNPRFVAGPGGDYYLAQTEAGQPVTSPCVDAGDPASPTIIGTTRTDGFQDVGVVDMGYHYLVAGEWIPAFAGMTGNAVMTPDEEIPPLSRGDRGDLATIAVTPNPFNPITAISYELQAASHVSLKVYDLAGRLVTTLVDGQNPAGTYTAVFDGTNLPSGIYLYQLASPAGDVIGKLVLMK